jgi:transcriptional regulator with XRE-family HTH domain
MKKSMKSAVLPAIQRQLADLAQEMRSARLASGLTIEFLAAKAGSSSATVKRIERGDPSVSMGHWAGCMEALGILGRIAKAAAVTNDPGTQALQAAQLRVRGLRRDRSGHDF